MICTTMIILYFIVMIKVTFRILNEFSGPNKFYKIETSLSCDMDGAMLIRKTSFLDKLLQYKRG